MKHSVVIKLMLTLAISFMLSACINDEENSGKRDLMVGDNLPEFTVTMNDGSTASNVSLKEGVSLVLFFHTSCPDCQNILPIMQQVYDEYRLLGVKFAIISREEDSASISAYWETNGYNMPYSAQLNRAIYELFAMSRIPRVYINNNGVICNIFTDNPVPTYEELTSALNQLLL